MDENHARVPYYLLTLRSFSFGALRALGRRHALSFGVIALALAHHVYAVSKTQELVE